MASCSNTIDLPGVDEAQWQADKNGCLGIREEMAPQMEQATDHLKGLNQGEIAEVLGKPDKNQLYKRNQKFFIYEISGAEACSATGSEEHIYLSIRFNATGLAKEVMVYRE